MSRKVVWLIASCLAVAALFVVSCGPAVEEETAPPKSGEWPASTKFGELEFTVSADSTGIAKISFDFVEFKCGGSEVSGGVSIENANLWPITDNQFAISTSAFQVWDMVIRGEFDKSGTRAFGTWEIEDTTCSGTWESSPAP